MSFLLILGFGIFTVDIQPVPVF